MKLPHWLCLSCGIIITDSRNKPDECFMCKGEKFLYLGFEGEYKIEEVKDSYEDYQVERKLSDLE